MPDPTFTVGNVPVFGNLILAPMDGYSDSPFRSLCREMGSAMSYTEFLSAIDVVHTHPHLHQRLSYFDMERPIVYQLMDDSPERLLKAATKLLSFNPDIIDINLGCSARSVSNRGAGSGLLRAPEKIASIFQMMTSELPVPITAKIRLGWDDESRNYIEVVQALQENGAALIAVHGRTRKQAYAGIADWNAIAKIKQIATVPVLGNGDVRSVEDIDRMFAETGVDGIMIGRAAIGNPWIFRRLNRRDVSQDMVLQTMLAQLTNMLAFYGDEVGLRLFRKFTVRYCSLYEQFPNVRGILLTTTERKTYEKVLSDFLNTPQTISSI